MPKSVELFAGGGGMALGMLDAGFEHEQLIENDPKICNILRVNAERSPHLWKPENIREMDVLDWLKCVRKLDLEDIDLVAGGPPCQPFSISGAHAGHNDERNMFPAAVEAVRLIRPKLFVFENVPGLLRPSFLPYYDYILDQLTKPEVIPKAGEKWNEHHRRIRQARDGGGLLYRVKRQIINSADLGVPQVRPRVFLVGIREGISDADRWTDIPKTHSLEALLHDQWVTGDYWARYEIKNVPEIPAKIAARVQELRQQEELIARQLPPWITTRDALAGPPSLPEPIDRTDAPGFLNHWGIPGARSYRGHTGGPIDWPAKTLKAGVHGVCGGEAMIRYHDGSVRYLTIREAARVQSFPDDYSLPGTRSSAMRALGNAVAVKVAYVIGERLRGTTGI